MNAVTTPRGVLSLRAGFTRSADTTAYAVNDLVGVNTSVAAGNTIEVPNAVASPGDAVRVERVVLRKSNKSLTNAQFRVHGLCAGWGASGTRLAVLGTAASAAQTNSWPTTIYLGAATGLATGQTLRLRQLIGWSLADRPSATAVTAQARVAA